ncbi:helix-turn-helix transcriptional regulator [Modestobacter marinus]|uniref:helix-turn-helix transcriptional regulator n=1 Tax=Modestobacter marinus TaxID=477641 RepID=UPI001C951A52|nr:helix-turn-helix transcriptional regulator [Modestobacter marinus]
MGGAVDRGRESFGRRAWADAWSQLSAADGEVPLEPPDLERLAVAAFLTGREEESVDVWARAHHTAVGRGDVVHAARCAFWMAFVLANGGRLARAGGWIHRAQRLLDASGLDCVEQGYLRYAAGLRQTFEGDPAGGSAGLAEGAAVGDRFRDPQLGALARVGRGRCLIHLGEVAEGLAWMDDGMVAITAPEVSPAVVGDLYCTVIEGCQEVCDVRRAQEWTEALSRWCESQPQLVLYRGQCLVHRAELMLLHGAWPDAGIEVQRACDRLARPTGQPVLGAAHYVRAELHRLRGEFPEAEEAYRQAHRWGRRPEPGLAQLRLRQGRVDEAAAALRRALDEAAEPVLRVRLLAGYVEVLLARGNVAAARTAVDELSTLASGWNAPWLRAGALHATGAVLLAEGDTRAALSSLRRAVAAWCELGAPYDAARARVLIGLACRSLGDADGARLELDAARSVFQELAAEPDLASVEALSPGRAPRAEGGLTVREAEVLALVATGRTNQAIASELFISEKTVATHLSSVFSKLGLSSRSAATAYAYTHDLVQGSSAEPPTPGPRRSP